MFVSVAGNSLKARAEDAPKNYDPKKIKAWIDRKGWAYADIEMRGGPTGNSLTAILNGEVSFLRGSTKRALAAALGIRPDDLDFYPPDSAPNFDLRQWLNDPEAQVAPGVKATEKDKRVIEALFWEIYNKDGKK